MTGAQKPETAKSATLPIIAGLFVHCGGMLSLLELLLSLSLYELELLPLLPDLSLTLPRRPLACCSTQEDIQPASTHSVVKLLLIIQVQRGLAGPEPSEFCFFSF